jgi:multidrug efflux pump subunit AcrA (membrane-fusion protein)
VSSYKKPQVYVVADGAAHLVDVVAGGEYGTDFELISGLKAGDQVVVSGQNNLVEGQLVEIIGENK